MGKMTVIKPDGTTKTTVEKKCPELAVLQELVGGYIERMKIQYDGHVAILYFDEDGLIKKLPFNSKCFEMTGMELVGNVIMLQGIRA